MFDPTIVSSSGCINPLLIRLVIPSWSTACEHIGNLTSCHDSLSFLCLFIFPEFENSHANSSMNFSVPQLKLKVSTSEAKLSPSSDSLESVTSISGNNTCLFSVSSSDSLREMFEFVGAALAPSSSSSSSEEDQTSQRSKSILTYGN